MKIQTGIAQDHGKRHMQQDAAAVSDPQLYSRKGLLAVLSDGVGGMEAGDRYSQMAVREMMAAFDEGNTEEGLKERLSQAYQKTRQALLAMQEEEDLEGGATLVAVLIADGMCFFVSVGDSRIYLLRGRGLIPLNREHILGHFLDEKAALGLIYREDAERSIYRSALSNHIAYTEELPYDSPPRPFRLVEGDKILLASDGIFSALTDEEIRNSLMEAETGAQGADALIEAVRQKNLPRQDNFSVVCISV